MEQVLRILRVLSDLLPFAPLSRQELVKLYNYRQRCVHHGSETVVQLLCQYSNDIESLYT